MWRIGIDEAGRGPVIGPLVVGALCVPEVDLPLLHEMGVTDSKLLSESKRIELDTWIREQSKIRGWKFELHISKPSEIDCAMAMTNLNDHEVTLFASLARKLKTDGGGGILQLDACDSNAGRFGNNVANLIPDWPWEGWTMNSRHGADLHCLAVAGASILAKVARDQAIHSLSAEIGIELGSGYPSDPTTIAALPLLIDGPEPHDCLRWGWATVRNAWLKMHETSPPQRPLDPNAPPNAQRTLF
ncbi:MAG: ribonuclease HII [Candidatus Thalassarchaeaceae archaeon]|nr:ribonuclease HII [Candidatus Thalassarchaeaceae archaeon]